MSLVEIDHQAHHSYKSCIGKKSESYLISFKDRDTRLLCLAMKRCLHLLNRGVWATTFGLKSVRLQPQGYIPVSAFMRHRSAFVQVLKDKRMGATPAGQKEAIHQMNAGKTQTEVVAETFGVHRSTISRLVSERRVLERKA